MKRRDLLICSCAVVAWPLAARAQSAKKAVIGYLVLSNPEPIFSYFKEGLRKLGYSEGRNIQIEFRGGEGKADRLAGLAAELVRLKVDVLVAAQTPAATAAKEATSQIPIVMAGVGDPVATGLIATLARPGGNITGTTGSTTEMGGKLLELVREIVPTAKRVGVLANATDPFSKPFLEQLQRSGKVATLEISPVMIRDNAELGAAYADLVRQRTDVVIVQPSLQRKVAAALALQHRIPAFSPNAQFPGEGGLIGYSADQMEMHGNAASYVDRILKGTKPADLPVQQPYKFETNVNVKTAKSLGITIPRAVIMRADKIIE